MQIGWNKETRNSGQDNHSSSNQVQREESFETEFKTKNSENEHSTFPTVNLSLQPSSKRSKATIVTSSEREFSKKNNHKILYRKKRFDIKYYQLSLKERNTKSKRFNNSFLFFPFPTFVFVKYLITAIIEPTFITVKNIYAGKRYNTLLTSTISTNNQLLYSL